MILHFNLNKKYLVVFFVMFLFFGLFSFKKVSAATDCTATATTGVTQIECEALIAIYNSTGGSSWTINTNWNTNTAVSTWHAVIVSGGHVTKIMFNSSNNIVGVLPNELGDLTYLTDFRIYDNPGLTGAIPTSIGNLTGMLTLYLYANNLSGTIPTGLNNMPSLRNVILRTNQLTGPIPSGLPNTMITLNLLGNQLSGPIPNNIASMPSLTTFNIKNNKFVFSDMEAGFNSYCANNRVGFSYNTQLLTDTTKTIDITTDGQTLTITPEVAENANDSYQWYKDGVAISGATSRVFTKTAYGVDSGLYTYTITNSVVTGLTLNSNDITVPSLTPNPPSSDSIFYTIGSADFWVRGSISDTKDIAQNYDQNGASNGTFGYKSSYILNNNASNKTSVYSDGTLVDAGSDDVPPVYTLNIGHVSAGHGFNVPVVSSAGHNKTSSDIGSTWTDGTYQYVLAEISGNDLTFYSIAVGDPWTMRTSVSGSTLIHVSGATHTTNITVTSQVATQKYPAVKNIVSTIKKDGTTTLSVGDSGYASTLVVTEDFDVVDPSTINRLNNPWAWNDGEIWFHIRNIYTITATGTIIRTTYDISRPLNLGYIGVMQKSFSSTPAYDHTYYYIPKTKEVSGYNFKNIQVLDTAPVSQVNFNSTYIDDVANPPDRQIVFKKRNAEDNYDIGLAFGYGPYGDTAAENRNCLSYVSCWQINDATSKVYMMMVGGVGVVDDITYEAYAYRQFVDPKKYDIGKIAYWNNQNGRDLIYVDYHRAAINDLTELPADFVGKTIRIVESENIEISQTTVPSDGNISLSTTGDSTYGYVVLEVTDSQMTPVASIPSGQYSSSVSVTLSATGSTSIRYSESEYPSNCSSGTLYSSPLNISENKKIYVKACNEFGNSANALFEYQIGSPRKYSQIAVKAIAASGLNEISKNVLLDVESNPKIENIKNCGVSDKDFSVFLNSKNLKIGSRGVSVKVLQSCLNDQLDLVKDKITADGIFGKKTLSYVKNIQNKYSLRTDGIVGPLLKGKIKNNF